MRPRAHLLLPALACALAGCAVGPDYQRPPVEAPQAYAEHSPWKEAQPRDTLPKAAWWSAFNDPALARLEEEASTASPTLHAALARVEEAQSVARIARASLLPSLALQPSGQRERYSGNRQAPTPSTTFAYTSDSFALPVTLGYEIDLFGQARRAAEGALATAEAQEAVYRNVLLSVQSSVAQGYFSLSALAEERRLLERSVGLLAESVDLVRKRRAAGASSDLDLYEAQTQLSTVRATLAAVGQAEAEQRHALAVLVGANPSTFVPPAPAELPDAAPAVPVGLPSDLLERRPDIAAAERTLAAANARIGVAKAAFFPSIALTGAAGTNSSQLSSLLSWSSRQWLLGPSINLPLFTGGANTAAYREAEAAYTEAMATYQGQVLVAFQDVENGLSDLRFIGEQAAQLGAAAQSAHAAAQLSQARYTSGLASYLEVIDSQRTELASDIALVQARAARLSATVQLVRALGGGW
jgi:outer membrane protein, multidrug efflux system